MAVRGLVGLSLVLLLAGCDAGVPPGYPAGYPLPKNGTAASGENRAAELRYPQTSATALGDALLAELKSTGWTVTFDGGLDPTAGRLITATKDGRTVFASVGVQGSGSILVVKEGPASK